MKILACHLDERSAQLKREALGRIQVALAGAPPNCFYRLLQTTFGYKTGSTSPPTEDLLDGEDTVCSKKAVPSTSVGSVAMAKHPMSRKPFTAMPSFDVDPKTSTASPEATNATGFKPGKLSKKWSRTGLVTEYQPRSVSGEDKYYCPFPGCDYIPTQKFDTAATHVCRHLNIAIECHHCPKKFWSMTGWTKHCSLSHKGVEPVPTDADDHGTFTPLDSAEATDVTEEEQLAVEAAANLPPQHYSENPDFVEDTITETD